MMINKMLKKFIKNKKSISLMLSYVLLISITIALSIVIFSWLRLTSNIETVPNCEDGTSILITEYECGGGFNITIKNNGKFNINGFILEVSDILNQAPIHRLNSVDNKGSLSGSPPGIYYFQGPLNPGESTKSYFSNKNQDNIIIERIKKVKLQPFIIFDETRERILCEESIIKEDIENCFIKP